MPETLNGLLSGKYDSTKQRAVLLNGDRLRNYQSYTATMRLELLLTGQLVFTDAQFFDGLYFHWLASDEGEFEAFKSLMVSFQESKEGKTPPFSIAVKCRSEGESPNLDQVAFKTFCKQFQFSSVEHDDLAKAVFELSNDYSESYLTEYDERNWKILEYILKSNAVTDTLSEALEETYIRRFSSRKFELVGTMQAVHEPKKDEQNLESYIEYMTRQLRCYARPESSIAGNWEEYTEELRKVFDIKDRANRWGSPGGDGTWHPGAYRLKEYIAQPFPGSPGHSYREKMDDLLYQAKIGMGDNPVAERYFCRISDELNRSIGNRSKITTALDELERLNNHPPKKESLELVQTYFRDFRQLMNDRYNKTLAEQHGCQFLDLCDYTKVFDQIDKTAKMQTIVISQEWVNNLAALPWKDFAAQLKSHETFLKESFDVWMSAYKEFPKCDIAHVEMCLKHYLEQLVLKIAGTPSKESTVPEYIGPWDRAGTCDNDIRAKFSKVYRYPCYFIGGGSFEASPEGNEICILCTGQDTFAKENMSVLRLRFDKGISDDKRFDTLLAPVCNPLNGGALQENRGEFIGKLGAEWNQYLSLIQDRPEAFADTGSIHIVTDPAVVATFQEKTGRTIGVVYNSPYHLMVVDLVYEQEGKYFAYERILPTVKKGAVVVIPQYHDGFLLLKQYRHALRDYQYAFPRGFGEEGVSAADNVRKELEEELSARISEAVFLGTCVADSGVCGDKVNVFSCVVEDFSVNEGYEGIFDVIQVSHEELKQWMRSGKLNDGFTLSAYSLLDAHV